jgi:hypothetical protein
MLCVSGGSTFADQRLPEVSPLPRTFSVASAEATAALSQWSMIDDPLAAEAIRSTSSYVGSANEPLEHWVQLVPETELLEPQPASEPTMEGTIKAVSPIDTESTEKEGSTSHDPVERNIRNISLDITAPSGSMPSNRAAEKYQGNAIVSGYEPRPWQDDVYFWESPTICHRPLYFEERMLERHGIVRYPHLKPVVSGAHFFVSCAAMPYLTVIHPPCTCVASTQPSSLQAKRPASIGPQDMKATAVQTATVAGLILLIP